MACYIEKFLFESFFYFSMLEADVWFVDLTLIMGLSAY